MDEDARRTFVATTCKPVEAAVEPRVSTLDPAVGVPASVVQPPPPDGSVVAQDDLAREGHAVQFGRLPGESHLPYSFPEVKALPENYQTPYTHESQAMSRVQETLPMMDLDVTGAVNLFMTGKHAGPGSLANDEATKSAGTTIAKLTHAPLLADSTFAPTWMRDPPPSLVVSGVLGIDSYPPPRPLPTIPIGFFFPNIDLCISADQALPAGISKSIPEQLKATDHGGDAARVGGAGTDVAVGGVLPMSSVAQFSQVLMAGLNGTRIATVAAAAAATVDKGAAVKEEALQAAFVAARTDNISELDTLLLSGHFEIDDRDEHGNTMLIAACQSGVTRAVRLLLRRRAGVNKKNTRGNTALHYCFAYGYKDLAKLLIANGADETTKNNDGLTPYEGIDPAKIEAL